MAGFRRSVIRAARGINCVPRNCDYCASEPQLKALPLPSLKQNCEGHTSFWASLTITRRWQFLEDWDYRLLDGTVIRIPKGFICNGASCFLVSTGYIFKPSIIHDYAYTYGHLKKANGGKYVCPTDCNDGTEDNKEKVRKFWDILLRQECQHLNPPSLLNYLVYRAVRCFGKKRYLLDDKKTRKGNRRHRCRKISE